MSRGLTFERVGSARAFPLLGSGPPLGTADGMRRRRRRAGGGGGGTADAQMDDDDRRAETGRDQSRPGELGQRERVHRAHKVDQPAERVEPARAKGDSPAQTDAARSWAAVGRETPGGGRRAGARERRAEALRVEARHVAERREAARRDVLRDELVQVPRVGAQRLGLQVLHGGDRRRAGAVRGAIASLVEPARLLEVLDRAEVARDHEPSVGLLACASEPGPGADVGGASQVPVQMSRRHRPGFPASSAPTHTHRETGVGI